MKNVPFLTLFLAVLLTGSLTAGGLEVGSTVPNFLLKDVEGNDISSAAVTGDITVMTFVSTQCPISNAYNERMEAVYSHYNGQGVKFVFVNSNSTESVEAIKEHAAREGFSFPVYKDSGNVVADMFGAEFTPETYVMKAGEIVYHGRIDDARSREITDHSLRNSLDDVLAGRTPAKQETKAFGCTIKRVKKVS